MKVREPAVGSQTTTGLFHFSEHFFTVRFDSILFAGFLPCLRSATSSRLRPLLPGSGPPDSVSRPERHILCAALPSCLSELPYPHDLSVWCTDSLKAPVLRDCLWRIPGFQFTNRPERENRGRNLRAFFFHLWRLFCFCQWM